MADSDAKGSESVVVGDAARSKVPLSRRLSFWNNCFVLWGWVLVLSSFLVGGIVGQVFPLKISMPIIFFGTLSNGIVGALIGSAAARTDIPARFYTGTPTAEGGLSSPMC